jgi:hypothetical protein
LQAKSENATLCEFATQNDAFLHHISANYTKNPYLATVSEWINFGTSFAQ